eukprot:Rmarinus@m.19913
MVIASPAPRGPPVTATIRIRTRSKDTGATQTIRPSSSGANEKNIVVVGLNSNAARIGQAQCASAARTVTFCSGSNVTCVPSERRVEPSSLSAESCALCGCGFSLTTVSPSSMMGSTSYYCMRRWLE